MSLEVYINDRRIYLKPSTVVALTKQINDIAEIQKRQADFTNRFTVPMTPENMIAMESLNIPGNTSTRPYKWGVARIINSGVTIVSNGIGIVTETKQQAEYEILIYAGNYDLFSRIDGKLITDLDWSDLIHVMDKDSISDSWSNTDGYIYALADTMDGRITNTPEVGVRRIDADYMNPWVYSKEILSRIFAEANLQYTGSFFSSNVDYQNHVTLAAHLKDEDRPVKFEGLHFVPVSLYRYTTDPGIHTVVFIWDANSVAFNDYLAWDNSAKKYYAKNRGSFTIKSSLNVDLKYCNSIQLLIKKNGVIVDDQDIILTKTDGVLQSYLWEIEYTLDMDRGDYIEFWYEFYAAYVAADDSNRVEGTFRNTTIKVDSEITNFYKSEIDFSKYLPPIKQIDFLKAIMQQYGLLYQLRADGVYEFITIEDLLNGAGGVKDYSAVYQGEKSETYRIGNYGKTNRFTYNYNDRDKLGVEYADASFGLDIDDLNAEQPAVDSIIEACGDYYLWDEWEKIAATYSYENQENDPDLPPIWELSDNDKLKTALVERHFVNQVQLYDHKAAAVLANYPFFTTNFPVVQFKKLHWQVLADTYYPKFIKMLQKPIKKKVGIWQTPIDIYFLDMFKLAYFEQYQSFFYINKLNNFVEGKVTEAEIIKIN